MNRQLSLLKTFTGIQLPEVVPSVSRVQTELLPIRKGDSLTITLDTRYDPGRQFRTTLRQSLEYATVAYITNQPVTAGQVLSANPTAEQPNRSRVGIGIVLPLAQVLRIGRRPDAWLQYDLYTQDSVLLATAKEPLSRGARKRWSMSKMLVSVPENGFIRLSYVNRSRRPIWLSGLSVDYSPAKTATHTPARSAADSSTTDSLDTPTGKTAGSLAGELYLQSSGECGPDPGCTVCNPASDCYDPCLCEPGSCLPELDCNICREGTSCYDACRCNPLNCIDCQSTPYECRCNPNYCSTDPCQIDPNGCECNPANCGGGGGGGSGGPPSAMDYQYDYEPLNCDSYLAMWSYSSAYGKEHGAVITTDGQLIMLPSQGNEVDKTDFSGVYQDNQGRIIVTIYQKNGNWYIQTNDYSNGNGQPTVSQINGMIHTHPSGTSPNGNPWDTYNPSGNDLNLLNSFPGISQYINTLTGTFQFNSSGAIPGSSAPNSECN